jgi:hypothetical protein
MRVFIQPDMLYLPAVEYTLRLIAVNKGCAWEFTDNGHVDIIVGEGQDADIRVNSLFHHKLSKGLFAHEHHFADRPYIQFEDGSKDYLSTIFYLVNSVQEYNATKTDKYGRFPYSESLQQKFGIVRQNIVQQLIDELFARNIKLSKVNVTDRPSRLFLTHDIDSVYGAKNQDGRYALDNKKWLDIPVLLFNHYLGTPDWLRMETITDIEQQYGYTSAFFWLPAHDKENADYDMDDIRVRRQMDKLSASGFYNGLHKTRRPYSFAEELERLHLSGAAYNRYHFLQFQLPQAWVAMEGVIELDSSVGFAEAYGFRNSYGLPHRPFNLGKQQPYHVLNVPMMIMDRTLFDSGKNIDELYEEITTWITANKTNCIITLNWHNNFFTELAYKGYAGLYNGILKYCNELGLTSVSPQQLLQEFKDA